MMRSLKRCLDMSCCYTQGGKLDDRAEIYKMTNIGDLSYVGDSTLNIKKKQKVSPSRQLPSALNRHIQRSIFVTGLWKLSAKQFRPQLPRLQEHGWEINQDWISPIRTDELLAPEYCIEMVSCSCKKLKCVAGRCSYICRDNHLPCTDLCNCVDCENGDDMNSDIIIRSLT